VANYIRNKRHRHRAQRFVIDVPLCYRVIGEDVWRLGTSANMSRSGLLFVGDLALEPKTRIELTFELPVAIPGESGAQVMCRGTIARSKTSDRSDTVATIATTIDTYRLVRIGLD
jgi:hypothetical protein